MKAKLYRVVKSYQSPYPNSIFFKKGERDLNGQQLMAQYNIADEPHIAHLHTGITGAMKNVRFYQALLEYRKSL
ncbi:MAG: hypothetical protein Q7J65_10075 [Candidatus Marinimicrobia bacterium]|nr:hypothetical protein [Candidatus Neomarinimicrobiota bacterium]